jgi:hypothetical protein
MSFNRSPNQQDLSWFIDMQSQNRLELDPPYQRKSVWTYKDKQFFLDTIFNNYPCPAVYLQKENTPKGPLYNVVDGKQRLSTVLDFFAGKIRIGKDFSIKQLRGAKFENLGDEDRSHFYNYIFMVEQIRSDVDVDWGEVFQRVNKNQKKLGEQELRHARFDGWLITRAETEASEVGFWKDIGISTRSRSSRMKDVEFVSILMLVLLEKDFVGFPQHRIDELYAKYDFVEAELPETEDEAPEEEDSEDYFAGMNKETISEFNTTFNSCRDLILGMEEENNCITNYKRRITTDLYSLWAAIILDEAVRGLGSETLASRYAKFIEEVYQAFELSKKGEPINDLDHDVQLYFGNSTGAATEADNRKNRHDALVAFLKK